jgi:DNA-binding response OmpR family regulator
VSRALDGVRVLVVEDEFLIAHELATALLEAGAEVLGPCATARDAMRLMETQAPDIAVLDVLLLDGDTAPIADALDARGLPYVLATAAEPPLMPQVHSAALVLPKPTDLVRLVAALRSTLDGMSTALSRMRDTAH